MISTKVLQHKVMFITNYIISCGHGYDCCDKVYYTMYRKAYHTARYTIQPFVLQNL